MGDKLLVRMYNVEVGDCIYVRIPRGDDHFHMLIDCGTKGSFQLPKNALEQLAKELPAGEGPGKKRLDLIVVTHEHQDHIKGFDPTDFANIEIGAIWLTEAMDPEHPQANNARRLHAFATKAMRDIEAQHLALSPELADLVSLYGVDNEDAMLALRTTLPQANGIDKPLYVHADMTEEELGLEALGLDLKTTSIRVLAPERDIDHFYLGDDDIDEDLNGFQGFTAFFDTHPIAGTDNAQRSRGESDESEVKPANISESDFRTLKSRLLSNAFGFAALSSKVTNNTSVVLLIEWRNRRLLFVGDAEWHGEFKPGKQNGSWNVMWNKRNEDLKGKLDFLKIGHHGSTNSTPWNETKTDEEFEPAQILDAILPVPGEDNEATSLAIVSTRRKNYASIPEAELLAEIGKRVSNTRVYQEELPNPESLPKYEEREKEHLGKPQPWRTDLEEILEPRGFVEVEIEPGDE